MTPPRGFRGVAYEPEDPRIRRYPAAPLIGASSAPAAPLIDCVWTPWLDQASTESCVGHAIAQAVYVRQGAMGIPRERRIMPSPRDIYYRARASRHGYKNIADIGSNPVAGWEVLRPPESRRPGLGVVPWDALPWDPAHVDDPYVSATRHAMDHSWLEYRWILGEDSARGEELDALLRSGHPVTAAIAANEGMTRWDPETGPWYLRGDREGGHYICLLHVDEDGNYWAAGSYGTDYGVGGLHWIARHEILSSRTSYLATPVIDPLRIPQ